MKSLFSTLITCVFAASVAHAQVPNFGSPNVPNSVGGGSSAIVANSTLTTGFTAGQLVMSDGTKAQVGTNVKATSLVLNSGPAIAGSVVFSLEGQGLASGATGTSPGWYAQLDADTTPRVRVGLNASDVASIAFGPGNAVRDLFIERLGPAQYRFGTADVAAPVAQTFTFQNVVAGTSNTAGVNTTFKASAGTGTGAGGSLIFQVAPAGSTGTAQNAFATALTIDSTKLATFASGVVSTYLAIGGAAHVNPLDVTGSVAYSGQLLSPAGSAGTPAIAFTGANGGIYSSGSGRVDISFGGGLKHTFWSDGSYYQNDTAAETVLANRAHLTSPVAATLQHGSADASSGAVAQTITFQGNTGASTTGPVALIQGAGGGSGAGSVGGELRLSGGLSSAAAGTGGALTFYTAPSGAGNAGVLALTIGANGGAVFASTLQATVITATSGLTPAAAGFIQWAGRTTLRSPANAQFNINNAAENAGTGFDVSTDAVLKVRTRAQSSYATVDALGFKVSGTAGASGGPFSAVTSITVVNGIVTAISGT